MIDDPPPRDLDLERASINGETARIPWRDLQRFFAAGKVFHVQRDLDLVEVAYAIQQDDVERVENWAAAAQLARVPDELAKDWFEREATLWAVVVKPWVLVQETG